MTGIRRTLVLLALPIAVVLGGTGPTSPAQASFGETVPRAIGSVATPTVQPPTHVEARPTSCDPAAGTVRVEWQRSATAEVSGYRVAIRGAGSSAVTQTGPSAEDVLMSLSPELLAGSPTVTVSTQTRYGWTADSVGFEWLPC